MQPRLQRFGAVACVCVGVCVCVPASESATSEFSDGVDRENRQREKGKNFSYILDGSLMFLKENNRGGVGGGRYTSAH